MAEKKADSGWKRWGLIGAGVVVIALVVAALLFIFFLPSFFALDEQGVPLVPEMPEVILRLMMVLGVFVVGVIFLAAVIFIVWELLFKKKELHIVKEHHKIIKEATELNPVKTLNNLVLTGANKIQSYPIGKIVGHTQIPINFERYIHLNPNGKIDESLSETEGDLEKRKDEAKANGRDCYDFFAFICRKGVYAIPLLNLLESPKIFACYPTERTPDLVGDVEIYDVGTWKLSGVNLFVPGRRHQEPKMTLQEMEGQLFPIAHLSLIDYIGLVAQRGIEGDTSMQKWLQAKASTVNIKESE